MTDTKGMTNKELINSLIEHYAECGEVEVELELPRSVPYLRPESKYFVVTFVTETHTLYLKEVPEFKEKKS